VAVRIDAVGTRTRAEQKSRAAAAMPISSPQFQHHFSLRHLLIRDPYQKGGGVQVVILGKTRLAADPRLH